MNVIRTSSDAPVVELAGMGVVLVIGVFDGVHSGHRFLFERALNFAAGERASVVAYTFWPYPAHFYAKNSKKIILSPEYKFNLIASLGVRYVVEQRFDADFAVLTPEDFVELLEKKFDTIVAVCIGANFKFGHDRLGDAAKLKDLCGKVGIETLIIDEFCMDGERVSSSKIRTLIDGCDFAAANRLLGDGIF
jgi:riboflavin kinase/FMN adenylyltransferase